MPRASHRECYVRKTGRTPKSNRTARTDHLTCVDCGKRIDVGASFAWYRDNVNGARHGTAPRTTGPVVPGDQGYLTPNGTYVPATVVQGEIRTEPAGPTFPDDLDASEEDTDAPDDAPETDDATDAPRPIVTSAGLSPIAAAILAEIAPHVRAEVDPKRIARMVHRTVAPLMTEQREGIMRDVANVLANYSPNVGRTTFARVYDPIPTDEGPNAPEDIGPVHRSFAALVQEARAALRDGMGLWIHGGAGWGKTYHVHLLSRVLGMTYRMQGAIADRYTDLLGYVRPTDGVYQRTQFRDSIEHGGLHLFDEIDASTDPGTPLAINAALANGMAPFPDKLIPRAANVLIIGNANTVGLGATARYTGRIRFDGAFLDRFVPFAWEEDEDLESTLYPDAAPRVQEIRARAKARAIDVVISMRASAKLQSRLSLGMDPKRAERVAIGGLMTESQWQSVSA